MGVRQPGIEPGTNRCPQLLQSAALPTELLPVAPTSFQLSNLLITSPTSCVSSSNSSSAPPHMYAMSPSHPIQKDIATPSSRPRHLHIYPNQPTISAPYAAPILLRQPTPVAQSGPRNHSSPRVCLLLAATSHPHQPFMQSCADDHILQLAITSPHIQPRTRLTLSPERSCLLVLCHIGFRSVPYRLVSSVPPLKRFSSSSAASFATCLATDQRFLLCGLYYDAPQRIKAKQTDTTRRGPRMPSKHSCSTPNSFVTPCRANPSVLTSKPQRSHLISLTPLLSLQL